MNDFCDHCEQVLQPFLDRALSDEEQAAVELHLQACSWCTKRYRFESELRGYVRVACEQEMPPDLKARLAALRTPLV